jgi:hypothetical protein
MSYYEKRIAELEARVAELSHQQRLKAIPIEAKLLERYALMQAENKRLRKAGDAMAEEIVGCYEGEGYDPKHSDTLKLWNSAKDGKPTEL